MMCGFPSRKLLEVSELQLFALRNCLFIFFKGYSGVVGLNCHCSLKQCSVKGGESVFCVVTPVIRGTAFRTIFSIQCRAP